MNFLMTTVGILLAAAARMAVGMFWYSESGFGKQWMKWVGFTVDPNDPKVKKQMQFGIAVGSLLSALIASVLTCFMVRTGATGLISAILLGFTAWVGFMAPIRLSGVLWERKPFNLYLVNATYDLVTIVAMSAILSFFV